MGSQDPIENLGGERIKDEWEASVWLSQQYQEISLRINEITRN